jgi:hypothetical protein
MTRSLLERAAKAAGIEHWMTAYEQAYRACNGADAKVVICGNGWYRIAAKDGSNSRLRKGDILEMTARLEQRASGQDAKD